MNAFDQVASRFEQYRALPGHVPVAIRQALHDTVSIRRRDAARGHEPHTLDLVHPLVVRTRSAREDAIERVTARATDRGYIASRPDVGGRLFGTIEQCEARSSATRYPHQK